MGFPLLDIVSIAGKLIDKILPDKAANEAAKAKVLEMQFNGEMAALQADTSLAQGQNDVNKVEAANTNVFVSGWRPFIGWVCGSIFVSNYMLVPLLAWLSPYLSIPPPPRLDIGEVMPVLLGMMGLGAMRTTEKIQKVA